MVDLICFCLTLDVINSHQFNGLGTVLTANIDVEASLELELSLAAPEVTTVQIEKNETGNSKGNFMKNVKGGIVALLEQRVADSNPSE